MFDAFVYWALNTLTYINRQVVCVWTWYWASVGKFPDLKDKDWQPCHDFDNFYLHVISTRDLTILTWSITTLNI